jgi:hypothetical protein
MACFSSTSFQVDKLGASGSDRSAHQAVTRPDLNRPEKQHRELLPDCSIQKQVLKFAPLASGRSEEVPTSAMECLTGSKRTPSEMG